MEELIRLKKYEDFTALENVNQSALIQRIEQLEEEKAQYQLAARENLRQCEAKYQAMLESVDDYITLVDRNFMLLWANRKAREMFGPDIVGKS